VPIENARDFSFSVAFPAVIHTCDAKSGMTKARDRLRMDLTGPDLGFGLNLGLKNIV
jgi:hypothetical protein